MAIGSTKIDANSAVDDFLNEAVFSLVEDVDGDGLPELHSDSHRTLRVVVSEDRLEAKFEALFSGTTLDEVEDALLQAHIRWGKDEKNIREALEKAQDTGHVQRNVVVAVGKPAVYKQQKEVSYPFLEAPNKPEDAEPIHVASSIIRKITEIMRYPDIERVRAYALPVVMVEQGDLLMKVVGKDVIEPGCDVFGKEIKRVSDEDHGQGLKAGEGVELMPNGDMVAERFGYVTATNHMLKVLSPIWISATNMEAYFFNPPAWSKRPVPTPHIVKELLKIEGICFGIDEVAISAMCKDLAEGKLRESCVRIAHGEMPNLSKGQTQFHFEMLPTTWFERLKRMLQGSDEPNLTDIEKDIPVVSAGQILATVAIKEGASSSSGRDLFDCPVTIPEVSDTRPKNYKTGPNVRREVQDGQAIYVSEIYGYPGVLNDKMMVLPPIWLAPDKMAAYCVGFAKDQLWPSKTELTQLLELGHIRFGIQDAALENIESYLDETALIGCVAKGEKPQPGEDGKVELLFKQHIDPGKLVAGDKIDFREREGVPQAKPRDLLARRTFPTPGKPGRDVRGRLIPPPNNSRGILYAGKQVVVEEDAKGRQLFYATGMGLPRVIKDTLSVMKLYHHKGDVDYRVGNIKMEGDVAIEGTVKNRFRVEATGDIYIEGGVDRSAQVVAGGNIIVQRGIVGAEIRAKGCLSARFIQESKIHVESDLLVRNYISDSRVVVFGKAVVQGDDGGQRQLCLLGGELFAGECVDVASVGSPYGRATGVMTGIDMDLEKQSERYKKGLAFADLQIRRAMRGLGGMQLGKLNQMLPGMPPNKKKFVLKCVHDLNELRKLRESIDHHLVSFKDKQRDAAANAFIRVHLSAFQKVSLQIQARHTTLSQDIQKILFKLDKNLDVIVCEPIA